MRYEINPDTFAVSIFNENETVPFWFQPDYPNGDSFDSIEEATAWAILAKKAQESDTEPYPPAGKGLEGAPKVMFDE